MKSVMNYLFMSAHLLVCIHGHLVTLRQNHLGIYFGYFPSPCRKKDSRVEWLYSGPASTVNREEYLLGKKIDKLVDPTLAEAEREKEVNFIMFCVQKFGFVVLTTVLCCIRDTEWDIMCTAGKLNPAMHTQ